MADVIVDRVSKHFGDLIAVDRASFVADRERFLTLLGPSGCGKTTVLRLIAGFELPDEGDVRIGETSLLGSPPERRRIGMVFQNYALFPHMNVGKNVAYGLRFRRHDNPGERVAELLDIVGLSGFQRRRPTELSAGQQQRVALARTLAPSPRVLLLDEPLSALDASLRETLRFEIRRIQHELRLTMIYVTHDQEESLGMSDRIAVMRAGRIEQIGSPRDVYERPETAFVASFLGRANRIDGIAVDRRGDTVHVDIGPTTILAVPRENLIAGDRVSVFIKAEHVSSAPAGEPGLDATVVTAEYAGSQTTIHVQTAVGPLRLSASTLDPPNYGDRIALRFPRETCHAFSIDPSE